MSRFICENTVLCACTKFTATLQKNHGDLYKKITAKFTTEFTVDFYNKNHGDFLQTNHGAQALPAAAQARQALPGPAIAQPRRCKGVCGSVSAPAALGGSAPPVYSRGPKGERVICIHMYECVFKHSVYASIYCTSIGIRARTYHVYYVFD